MQKKVKLEYRMTRTGSQRAMSIDVYMPADLEKVVRTLALQNKLTLNSFICGILRDHIEQGNGGRTVAEIARMIPDVAVPRRQPKFKAASVSEEDSEK